MLRTHSTKDITPEIDGQSVTLGGWVHSMRQLGSIKFLILRDMHGQIQVIAKKGDIAENISEKIGSLRKEDVIIVKGRVKKNPSVAKGIEIIPEKIDILAKSDAPLPLDMNVPAGIDKRLDWRPIDLRKPEVSAIFKIQAKLVQGMEEWLDNNGFVKVFTPCIMGMTSEGGADVFSVTYFLKQAFLRQDPQLHRQLAIAGGIDKVYDTGPSWRADPSHTSRHLCEHRGCAIELAFIKDEYDVMRVEESLVVAGLKKVKEACKPELELLGKTIEMPKLPLPVLNFPEVYDILEEMGKPIAHGKDLNQDSEVLLTNYVRSKHNQQCFFVNRFPSGIKPFYVMRYEDEPEWARSTDFIFKGTELSSGGQREHRHLQLMKQVKEKKMIPEGIKWFTEHFKYGVPPHGGFCIGLERLVMKILDLENVKEAALFPRTQERLVP